MEKNKVIEKVYNDPLGFGAIKNTLEDARKIDNTITLQDAIPWKENNIERKTQLKGYNPFITHKPFEEFQVDVCFMHGDSHKYNVALLMVCLLYTSPSPRD